MQCLTDAPLILFLFSSLSSAGPYMAGLLCATACQSRPRRPGHKHRAAGDKQDEADTVDPWNQ